MKKSILYIMALCLVCFSCSKVIKVPLQYSVTDTHGVALQNVYVVDSGSSTFQVWVKFLQGNTDDSVKLILTNLPTNTTASPDTFSAKPTYTANLTINTYNVPVGTYPVSLVSYTPTQGYTTNSFNLVVIPASCSSLFAGTLSASNACSSSNYSYTAVGTSTGGSTLSINNFGGYGTNTNTIVDLDCEHGTVTVPAQNIGNGVTVSGSGTFNGSQLIISYAANNIPSGGSASCTVTFTR